MMKTVKEILKTMTAGRLQANQGDHTVMTCPILEPHMRNRNTNN